MRALSACEGFACEGFACEGLREKGISMGLSCE